MPQLRPLAGVVRPSAPRGGLTRNGPPKKKGKGSTKMPRRITLPLVTATLVILAGCDTITGLFDGEPDHWAASSIGYPFTASYDIDSSIEAEYVPDCGTHTCWRIVRDSVPAPSGIREATQRALDRWSRALAATPTDPPPQGQGDCASEGYHVIVRMGNALLELNSYGPVGWFASPRCGTSSGRPRGGLIALDHGVDWPGMDPKWVETVITHEIGHALGFRAGSFDREAALAVANGVAPPSQPATRLPVDHGGHWTCMHHDIMTAHTNPASRIGDVTIAAMAPDWRYDPGDVEYTIDRTELPNCWRD